MLRDNAIRAAFHTGGHPGEWTINIPGYDHETHIPAAVNDKLAAALGPDFEVCNRGSRLEVTSSLFEDGKSPHQDTIADALAALNLGPATFEVAPYTTPAVRLRNCSCGCGQQLTMREVFEHLRAAKSTTT